ncbi:MAG: nitrous oxide-stimulated promoter family protein [Phycisphaerae bacterium]
MMPARPKIRRQHPQTPRLLRRDLRTLTVFIEIYCRAHHENRQPFELKGFNIKELAGHACLLCPDCSKLLAHALVKRTHCPQDPKPMCKHCPNHCYQTGYREKIRDVMRFSGKRLLLSGRLDYLLHLYF